MRIAHGRKAAIYCYISAEIQGTQCLTERRKTKPDGFYYLPVEVETTGDRTASNLQISLTLNIPSGQSETAGFNIVYLSGRAIARGTAVFHSDPRQCELTTTASFIEP